MNKDEALVGSLTRQLLRTARERSQIRVPADQLDGLVARHECARNVQQVGAIDNPQALDRLVRLARLKHMLRLHIEQSNIILSHLVISILGSQCLD